MKPAVIISFAIIGALSGCVKYYEMDLPEKDKRLVFEGVFTNENKSCTFMLSQTTKYSYKYYYGQYVYEKGATLILSDNAGNMDTLIEISSGRYRTDSSKIRGVIGRSYKMDIITQNGKHYVSTFEKMANVPPIDSIYYERDINDRSKTFPSSYRDNVYIDWHDPKDTVNYYMEYVTYYWNNIWQDKYRWSSVFNDYTIDGQSLKKMIVYSGYDGKYFLIKVNIYSLTKENYDYWVNLYQQISPGDDADVNTSTPLIGNIYNISDSKDYVLGYFQVSASSSKQVYVDH
jgi:hypothetical protein